MKIRYQRFTRSVLTVLFSFTVIMGIFSLPASVVLAAEVQQPQIAEEWRPTLALPAAVVWTLRVGGWALEIWGAYEATVTIANMVTGENCPTLKDMGKFGEWISRARPGDTHRYPVVCTPAGGGAPQQIVFEVTYISSVEGN